MQFVFWVSIPILRHLKALDIVPKYQKDGKRTIKGPKKYRKWP